MTILYVVTSGEYSDYKIESIFSTKEKAEKFCSLFPEDNFQKHDIEEWTLDEYSNKDKKEFSVSMRIDGHVDHIFQINPGDIDKESYFFSGDLLHSYCYADDTQHAIKITNERRVKLIALGLWGKEEVTHDM